MFVNNANTMAGRLAHHSQSVKMRKAVWAHPKTFTSVCIYDGVVPSHLHRVTLLYVAKIIIKTEIYIFRLVFVCFIVLSPDLLCPFRLRITVFVLHFCVVYVFLLLIFTKPFCGSD